MVLLLGLSQNTHALPRLIRVLVVCSTLRRMATFVNQHGALEGHHFDPVLIQSPSEDRYDPLRGSALRVALVQDRALSVDGISREDRVGHLDLVPTKVGDYLSGREDIRKPIM
jgi:hypothetical protein